MVKDEIVIDGASQLRRVSMRVKMPRLFGVRFTIAIRLFQLAGWVAGTTIVIEVDDDQADEG